MGAIEVTTKNEKMWGWENARGERPMKIPCESLEVVGIKIATREGNKRIRGEPPKTNPCGLGLFLGCTVVGVPRKCG